MEADRGKVLTAFGFLTVLESPEHGLFGGYLVLSPQGRPLEFRCSAPVRATRAQEILYGPTLRPYLFAEVIGQALISGSQIATSLILTDRREMLELAALRNEMIAFVEPLETSLVAPTCLPSEVEATLDVGGRRLAVPATTAQDLAVLQARAELLATHVDLCEPFGRVHAALAEVQLGAAENLEDDHDGAAAA